MVKHLEPDYELDKPIITFVSHFWDTIDALGGPVGLSLIILAVFIFYIVVDYTIFISRQRRENKQKKK
jgi:hypothetical protein